MASFLDRPSDAFRIVSLRDPALLQLPMEQIAEYELSRDIRTLTLDQCKDPRPVVFTAEPLRPEHEDYLVSPSASDLWFIFSHYVRSVEGPWNKLRWNEDRQGRRRIDPDCRKDINPEVMIEVASVIVEAASHGEDIPFTTALGTWREQWTRYHLLHALQSAREKDVPTDDDAR